MTDPSAPVDIKAKHRAMWAFGDYRAVATDVIGHAGPILVEACGIGPEDRVLDIAAGAGNAAIPAALRGADVVASDLTPELLEAGRKDAEAQGATLTWEVADAEALPYEDESFDVVMSCVGVMFAPNHQQSADELLRVTRPGGRIGLLSWTPAGFIGQLFATMKPFAPPPPPGAQPPPLWGDEEHVRQLFGDRVTDVRASAEPLHITRFGAPEEFRDFFKAFYGPTIAVYKSLADQPERIAELDQALVDLATRFQNDDNTMDWEYLLLVARKG